MCGAKYLKSIESSLMLISSCCDDPLFDTLCLGSGGIHLFESSFWHPNVKMIKMSLQLLLGTSIRRDPLGYITS